MFCEDIRLIGLCLQIVMAFRKIAVRLKWNDITKDQDVKVTVKPKARRSKGQRGRISVTL
jgi:hypothetical protein